MKGRITVKSISVGGTVMDSPSDYEYGISTNPNLFPTQAQLSHIFDNLFEGIYYVFFRKIHAPWSKKQVLANEVKFLASASSMPIAASSFRRVDFSVGAETIQINDNVVSNSEQIYLNGILLKRGIDYTPNDIQKRYKLSNFIELQPDSIIDVWGS